jgi:hypothetical protein
VDQYLDNLGGRRIFDVGIGSNHSKENLLTSFRSWKEELLLKIKFVSSVGYNFESFRDLKSNKSKFKVECLPYQISAATQCKTLRCCKFGIPPEFDQNKTLENSTGSQALPFAKAKKYDAGLQSYNRFQDMQIINVEELRDQSLTDQ